MMGQQSGHLLGLIRKQGLHRLAYPEVKYTPLLEQNGLVSSFLGQGVPEEVF
ncbi:MAG TPA: hypothetical protein VLE70_09810 [Anaerolineae bacterium]|jgi:hypothetical protein|nr:hypothetical protein [Anaerolineae bacterium]